MSKLAHSNQETMDEIDMRRAIDSGNEDLLEMFDSRERAAWFHTYWSALRRAVWLKMPWVYASSVELEHITRRPRGWVVTWREP